MKKIYIQTIIVIIIVLFTGCNKSNNTESIKDASNSENYISTIEEKDEDTETTINSNDEDSKEIDTNKENKDTENEYIEYNNHLIATNIIAIRLIGESEETAINTLNEYGINDIEILYEYNEYMDEGIVISQNYPEGAPYKESFKYSLTISKGSDPKYHDEIIELCDRKGWDKTLIPMITSSIKFIINNTLLSSQEVISRLDKNVSQIIIPEEALAMDGQYILEEGNILLNTYTYSEKILIHEFIHALSYHKDDGKFAFLYKDNDFMNMTEGYTDTIATKSINFKQKGTPVLYDNMDTNQPILIYKTLSQAYSVNSSVMGALMYLTGENLFEEMFWADTDKFEELVSRFDEQYGKGTWESLCKYIELIPHNCENPNEDKTDYIINYYDKILECFKIDLEHCSSDESLIDLSKRMESISLTIPLYFHDYKTKLNDIRLELNEKLKVASLDEYINDYYAYSSPDFYNCPEGKVGNYIRAMYNPHMMYTYSTYNDQIEKGNVIKIEYKEISSGVGFKELKPGDILPEGCEIAITISNGIDIGEGYVIVPMIKEYGTKLDNIDDVDNAYIIWKLKESGLNPEIEWVEVPQMPLGSILGQDLEAGVVVKKGSKIVIRVSKT